MGVAAFVVHGGDPSVTKNWRCCIWSAFRQWPSWRRVELGQCYGVALQNAVFVGRPPPKVCSRSLAKQIAFGLVRCGLWGDLGTATQPEEVTKRRESGEMRQVRQF